MNFPPLNVNNLVMRHVNLPGVGPVFLVDNFGLVTAPNEYTVAQMISESLFFHGKDFSKSITVQHLITSGITSLLSAVNYTAYAIYKVGERYGVLHVGTENLYHVRDETQLKEVLEDFQNKFKFCKTRVGDLDELGEPLYVGFTAMTQQPHTGYWTGCAGRMDGSHPFAMLGGRLPMQLVTTRIPAKENSKAVWTVNRIISALEEAIGESKKADLQQRFKTVEKRLSEILDVRALTKDQATAYDSLSGFTLMISKHPQDFTFTENDVDRMEAYINFIETPADKLSASHPLMGEKPIDMDDVVNRAQAVLEKYQHADPLHRPALVRKIHAHRICTINIINPSELHVRAILDSLETLESNTKTLTSLLRSIEEKKPTAEELKELDAMLSSWLNPKTDTKPVEDISSAIQIIGRLHARGLPTHETYQFPIIGIRNPENAKLSEMLQQVVAQRRTEKEAARLNETHFLITDVSDKVFVITDKTFGGSLTLHITDPKQKETLLRRLNGLNDLILEGRNALYYSDTILSAGENDFWKLSNAVISGPVKLVGKTVLHNVELRAGSYVDAMIENVK